RENPDLLALRLKPMEGDALSAFRGEVSGTDIDSISDEISALPKMEKLIVGNPRKLASSGEIVMAFAYPVTIRGAKTAEVIALASLRDINRTVVGIAPTREEELWNAGLPMIFVVDQEIGRAHV